VARIDLSSDVRFSDLAPTLSKLSRIKMNIPLISSRQVVLEPPSNIAGFTEIVGEPNAATAVQAASNDLTNVDLPNVKGTKLQQSIVRGAQQFLGIPYVWGGEDPSGFDCSGLVEYVFRQNGINTPRVTYEQFKSGKSINVNNVQPGDLVFFRMESAGPGHVGIYAGGGKFIHAPRTGDVVKISNLKDRSDLVGIRRYT